MAGRDAKDRAAPRPIKAIVLSITCFSIRVHSNRLVPSYARRAEPPMNVWPERPLERRRQRPVLSSGGVGRLGESEEPRSGPCEKSVRKRHQGVFLSESQ